MTKCDVKNYLEKIYNVPVGTIRTRIQFGKYFCLWIVDNIYVFPEYRLTTGTHKIYHQLIPLFQIIFSPVASLSILCYIAIAKGTVRQYVYY